MRLSATHRAWHSWQAAAGLWRGWGVCPALLAPETEDITPRASARPAADHLVASLARLFEHTGTELIVDRHFEHAGTALIIDLEPVLGVHLAARLNQLRLANAVLLLPRWPYAQAILPVDALLRSLVSLSTRLVAEDLPNVAFVLDAERTRAVPHRPANDERADNRYRLTVADLPNLAALRARGIRHVVRLSHGAARITRREGQIDSASTLFPRGDPLRSTLSVPAHLSPEGT